MTNNGEKQLDIKNLKKIHQICLKNLEKKLKLKTKKLKK